MLTRIEDKRDRICRDVEKGDHEEEVSPMDPPDAFAPPGEDQSVPYAEMHPLLQAFRDEHELCVIELDAFEAALDSLRQGGVALSADDGASDGANDGAAHDALSKFFGFLERVVLPHNRREEKVLFPLLGRRLVESGEHSKGPRPTTAVDVLLAEHLELLQLSAVMTNFFRIAPRLPDEASRHYVIDAAIRQGRILVEQLRLHIFREDVVVFSLAHKLLSKEELDRMGETD